MKRYEAFAAEQLRRADVSVGRALRNDVLTVGGKIFGFLKGDRLVVKLPAIRAAQLVEAGAAIPFTSGRRIMKQWVAVAAPVAAHDDLWRTLLDDARTYVAAGDSSLKRTPPPHSQNRKERSQ